VSRRADCLFTRIEPGDLVQWKDKIGIVLEVDQPRNYDEEAKIDFQDGHKSSWVYTKYLTKLTEIK